MIKNHFYSASISIIMIENGVQKGLKILGRIGGTSADHGKN